MRNFGDIANLLLDHKFIAVPVIDDDCHVMGIVSEGDLRDLLGEERSRQSAIRHAMSYQTRRHRGDKSAVETS